MYRRRISREITSRDVGMIKNITYRDNKISNTSIILDAIKYKNKEVGTENTFKFDFINTEGIRLFKGYSRSNISDKAIQQKELPQGLWGYDVRYGKIPFYCEKIRQDYLKGKSSINRPFWLVDYITDIEINYCNNPPVYLDLFGKDHYIEKRFGRSETFRLSPLDFIRLMSGEVLLFKNVNFFKIETLSCNVWNTFTNQMITDIEWYKRGSDFINLKGLNDELKNNILNNLSLFPDREEKSIDKSPVYYTWISPIINYNINCLGIKSDIKEVDIRLEILSSTDISNPFKWKIDKGN